MFVKFELKNIEPEVLLTHLGKLLDTMDFQRLRTSCDPRQNALIVHIEEDEETASKIESKIRNVVGLVDVRSASKPTRKRQGSQSKPTKKRKRMH